MAKLSVRDLDLKGKRVLVRVDFNVPVKDAFGTAHRAHASTAGVTKYFKQSAAGFLIDKEIQYLGKVLTNPDKPFVAIMGGSKVSDKILILEQLTKKVDAIIVGGG